jgi:hypothetical protein
MIDLDRYKKIIDEDFETFKPINKRFVQLEKSWIINISHRIMPSQQNGMTFYKHEDRRNLRGILLKYLKQKLSPMKIKGICIEMVNKIKTE